MTRRKIKGCMALLSGISIVGMGCLREGETAAYTEPRNEACEISDCSDSDILINEVCTVNHYSYLSQDGDFLAWIELYNQSERDISLAGYALTDSLEERGVFVFGDVTMPPGGYRIVYLANARATCFDQDSKYADLQLSNRGGRYCICLIDRAMWRTV